MSLILFVIIVLVLLALAIYAVELLPLPGPPQLKLIIEALIVVLAILAIADRAGVIR